MTNERFAQLERDVIAAENFALDPHFNQFGFVEATLTTGAARELIDEIKRLRAHVFVLEFDVKAFSIDNDRLRSELARYKTPNVDNVEVINEQP